MAYESHISGGWFVGEDKIFAFTVYQEDPNGVVTTTPQNISGWNFRWDLRRSDTEADPPVLSKTTASGISITSAAAGQGQVTIASADTDALQARVYRHSLKRMDSGSETELLYGNAVLGKRTTR